MSFILAHPDQPWTLHYLLDLQRELQRKSQNYVRSMLTGAAPNKDMDKSARNVDEWLQIETLADEKVQFANRLVELLSKACSRLDVDLNRIIGSGQLDQVLGGVADVSNSLLFGGRPGFDKMQDGLRAALATPDGSPPPPNSSHLMEPPTKRRSRSIPPSYSTNADPVTGRRLTAQMPARASPVPMVNSAAMPSRNRNRHGRTSMIIDDDVEDHPEADNDDDTIYCSCRKPSYDEVLSCLSHVAPYIHYAADDSVRRPRMSNRMGAYVHPAFLTPRSLSWLQFHVSCVGMVGKDPETWYCPDCAPKMEGELKRKRRK